MDFYDDFDGTAKRAPGPRHASRVDPDEALEIQHRLAARTVRRICNQHSCSGADCTHPNHRKDADYLLSEDEDYPGMLDMLGLPRNYPEITERDRIVYLKWLRQAGPPEVDGDLKNAA